MEIVMAWYGRLAIGGRTNPREVPVSCRHMHRTGGERLKRKMAR